MRPGPAAAALAAVLAVLPVAVRAAPPVAIVEEVEAPGAAVGILDYLSEGRRIDLGPDGRIVIGYLNSCLREEIARGEVVIGAEQSRVTDGTVSRRRVDCDGGRLLLSAREAAQSAAVVLRKPPPGDGGPVQEALRVFGLRPLFRLAAPAERLTVRRLDRDAPAVTVTVADGVADMADAGAPLARGGLYEARAGQRGVVFRVDRFAQDDAPLLGRLIEF